MSENLLQVRYTETGKVVYIYNGKVAFGGAIPWEQADMIARQSTGCARKAEEICKANRIIADNALLHRSGVLPGIGLSDHPAIKDETVKAALYDRDLRRYFPWRKGVNGVGAIQTCGAVGTPVISNRRAH